MKISDILTSKEPGTLDTVEWILRVTVVTLAMIMLAVVVAMLFGLFVKNIDNKEIFSIIGPAFNTIIGAFVGLLGGLSLNNINGKEEPAMEPEAPKPYSDPNGTVFIDTSEEDDDMEPWEKYRNDLRYDANNDGVVDESDFPDWRKPAV